MNGKPEDDPLGATPVLPPPTGAAAQRASHAFRDYVDQVRGPPVPRAAPPEPVPPAQPLPQPEAFGGGRRYDLALSLVQPAPAAEAETAVMAAPAANRPEPNATDAELTAAERPPPGAPTVRPPVQRKHLDTVPQELLETAADTALLTSGPDGTSAFDIVFNDDLFENLACRITVNDGRVVANFRVRDENTRRLLEAEAGMLRVRFEERGLKVAEIKVELESGTPEV